MDASRTSPAFLHRSFIGNFCDANCLGVASVDVMSMQEYMTSCVKVRLFDFVFLAGASVFSSCVLKFGCYGISSSSSSSLGLTSGTTSLIPCPSGNSSVL